MKYLSDQTIYRWLRELHVVRSQYHVSELCGRSPGWFSSTRCQGRDIPASTILMLVRHAHEHMAQQTDPLAQEQLRIVTTAMREQATQRILRKRKRAD